MIRYPLSIISLFLLVLLCSCAMTLPRAAETGNSAQLQALLQKGTPVDQKGGPMDETALMIAARHGNLGIVRTLIDAGADINAKSKYGDTALTAATYFCHPPITEFLLDHGADVNVQNYAYGSTPLMLANECNDISIVEALIKRGATINARNKKGQTTLITASIKGNTQIVHALLDAGANVEETWPDGGTALYEAAQQGHDKIVQELINSDANVNYSSTHNGWTPLMISSAEGHLSTVKLLLDAGADPNVINHKGRTALMFTEKYNFTEISKALIEHGAKK